MSTAASVCLLLVRKKSFTCSSFYNVNVFIQKGKLRTKKKTKPNSLKCISPDQLPVAELVQNLI